MRSHLTYAAAREVLMREGATKASPPCGTAQVFFRPSRSCPGLWAMSLLVLMRDEWVDTQWFRDDED
jgi:hypothetical protein